MNKDQHKYYRLLRQFHGWVEGVEMILDGAQPDHWLIRHHKGALIHRMRQLADRLEMSDAERESEAA